MRSEWSQGVFEGRVWGNQRMVEGIQVIVEWSKGII